MAASSSRFTLALLACAACAGGPSREAVERSQREYELGVGLWNEQNVAGAFEHLLAAIQHDPDNAEAHFFLGNLFMINRGDHDRAEHHFGEALRAHRAVPARVGLEADVENSLGVLYIHAQRYADAVEILRESARDLMNREPAVSWTNLGWAYYERGEHALALEALAQAVRLSPQLCMAWYRIGQVRVAREELAEAEQALDRALEVENETCARLQVGFRLRGEVRAQLGHRPDAIADLERCVELAPDTDDGRACRRLLDSLPSPPAGSPP